MKNKNEFALSVIIPSKTFDQSLIHCLTSVLDAITCYNESFWKEVKIDINLILKKADILRAKKYFQGRKNIIFLSQGGVLKGESYARNIGIKNCRGKITLVQAFFTMFCNFIYQLGRFSGNFIIYGESKKH